MPIFVNVNMYVFTLCAAISGEFLKSPPRLFQIHILGERLGYIDVVWKIRLKFKTDELLFAEKKFQTL